MVPVNYWAIIASAVFMMVLGAIWYGPLFGRQWAALMGLKMPERPDENMKREMMKSYSIMGVGALLMSFVFSHLLVFAQAYLGTSGVSAGLQAGFWNWLGFIAPLTLGPVLWEGKPWKLWFINAGYYLVGLLAIGVILAMWQ